MTDNTAGMLRTNRIYRGILVPEGSDERLLGWKDGVDVGAGAQDAPDVLKITGWTRDAVRAFAHVTEDDSDTARRIVRDMSPKDRAVLEFWLHELSLIIEDTELSRRTAEQKRTRDIARRTYGLD